MKNLNKEDSASLMIEQLERVVSDANEAIATIKKSDSQPAKETKEEKSKHQHDKIRYRIIRWLLPTIVILFLCVTSFYIYFPDQVMETCMTPTAPYFHNHTQLCAKRIERAVKVSESMFTFISSWMQAIFGIVIGFYFSNKS